MGEEYDDESDDDIIDKREVFIKRTRAKKEVKLEEEVSPYSFL